MYLSKFFKKEQQFTYEVIETPEITIKAFKSQLNELITNRQRILRKNADWENNVRLQSRLKELGYIRNLINKIY